MGDACCDCRHYISPQAPGKPGFCTHPVRDCPVYLVDTCEEWEEWEEMLPFGAPEGGKDAE